MKWKRRERVERMKREIERRGGIVHVDDRLPLELQERFLREVLDCPECGGGKEKAH